MKLSINFLDSGIKSRIKKRSSKVLASEISVLEKTFIAFLTKNHHFKGVKAVTITMTLCGRTKMRTLNREFRQKDYATDVLSFPVFENLRPDKLVKKSDLFNLPFVELGDLVICKEKARSQAREFKITYEQEIIHLAVHGFLHLLGFDHEISSKEERIMESFEADLVDKVYKKLNVKNKA